MEMFLTKEVDVGGDVFSLNLVKDKPVIFGHHRVNKVDVIKAISAFERQAKVLFSRPQTGKVSRSGGRGCRSRPVRSGELCRSGRDEVHRW